MLELPTLWISAPTAAWPPGLSPTAPFLRRILTGEGREVLGHVALAPGRWVPWPAGPQVAAYEEPDASLLFRARGLGWLRRTILVTEADGNAVAYVYDNCVVTSAGRLVAAYRRARGRGAFIGAAGSEVAGWTAVGGGMRVDFAAELRNEPFAKMALLAAVLMEW